MTRTVRFAARCGLAIGIWTLAFAACVVLQSCTADGPTAPTPTSEAPAPVAAAPAPAPTATPSPTDPNPVGNGRECSLSGATLTLKNTDPISHSYFGWSTDFDQATTNKGVPSVIRPGDTYDYTDPAGKCRQLDIAHEYNGIALCFAFLDKNGESFNPSSSPAKVTECRTVPCVEEWREQEERVVEYGEWGSCKRGDTQEGCYKSRKVTTIIYETNSCTRAKREKSRIVTYGTTPCECECVETKEPREIPGTVYWTPGILQGECRIEVGPIGIATLTPTLCHEVGQQQIGIDYLCQEDGSTTRDLCRNVACPQTCDNTPASYKGNANGGLFNLQNSGDAAELAWVNSNVLVGPWEKFADEGEKDDDCTSADVSAKVVIVKAGSSSSIEYSYKTYLNVTAGQQLCSYDPPGSDKPKDISHVTYFRCD